MQSRMFQKLDAGTIELIKSLGIKIESSADLVQLIEARWDNEQSSDQFETAKMLRETVDIAFNFIGDEIKKEIVLLNMMFSNG